MTRNRLIIYSLVVVALFGLALYRSATGPDPEPAPDPEMDLPRDGANPGALNDTRGEEPLRRDVDGDDPGWVSYSYQEIQPIFTARCFSCHSQKEKVGPDYHFYDYDSVHRLVEPGELTSPLPSSVAMDGSMRQYLSDQEANRIREWVLNGARP